MDENSAADNNQSGLESDLNRYKQAAELAYRYAKTKAEDEQAKEESPFGDNGKKESTKDKETF